MLKQELIDEVQRDEYKDICKKMSKNIWEDLYQELLIIILEYDEAKIQRIKTRNNARFFIVGILCNMVKSTRSDFFKKYRNSYELTWEPEAETEDGIEYEKSVEEANKLLEDEYWFDKHIFKKYIESGSLDKTVAATGISKMIIRSSLAKTKKNIRNKMEKIKILLITTKDDTGLKYHRQIAPHARMMTTHPEFDFTLESGGEAPNGQRFEGSIDNIPEETLKEFKIVYYLRQVSFNQGNVKRTIDKLHSMGIKVILDIDDYWKLNSEHHMSKLYKQINVPKETEEAIKQVDYVITTTDYFADHIRDLNPNVCVLPNCINPEDPQFTPRKIESSKLRFGWIGGVYHGKDIEAISENFCRLAKDKESRDKYQICLGGFNYPNKEYENIEKDMTCNYEFRNYDATYTNYLFTYTPTMEHISYDKSYRRLWAKDVYHYGELYNEIDVSVVPLIPNEFNKCKSELKLVEAGAMGKAVIVSDTEPYKQWIKNGVNGIKINPNRNNIDWYIAMRKLIKEPNMVKDLADGLKETISEHFNIDKHNETRAELYKSLL